MNIDFGIGNLLSVLNDFFFSFGSLGSLVLPL